MVKFLASKYFIRIRTHMKSHPVVARTKTQCPGVQRAGPGSSRTTLRPAQFLQTPETPRSPTTPPSLVPRHRGPARCTGADSWSINQDADSTSGGEGADVCWVRRCRRRGCSHTKHERNAFSRPRTTHHAPHTTTHHETRKVFLGARAGARGGERQEREALRGAESEGQRA